MTKTGVRTFDEAISAMHAALPHVLDAVAAPQLALMVAEFGRFVAAVEAARLELDVAVDRLEVHRVAGARDTASFLADVTGTKAGVSQRDVDTAQRLAGRQVVADALATGAISPAKAAALARLESTCPDEQAERVRRATRLSVRQVEAEVAAANHVHHPQPPAPPTTDAWVERGLDRAEARLHLSLLQAETVEAAWRAAADDLDLPHDLPTGERLGGGAVAVAHWYLGNRPTADAPPLRSRTTMYVTVDLDTLARTERGCAHLGSGAVIDAATARATACDAGVSRVLTDSRSLVLDIGRTSRTIPTGLAAFLAVDDQGCRWPGCTAPAWACEAHHIVHWASGGRTDRDSVALACWHHHELIHRDPGWQLGLTPGDRILTVRYNGVLVGTTNPSGLERRRHERRRRRRRLAGPVPASSAAPVAERLWEDLACTAITAA